MPTTGKTGDDFVYPLTFTYLPSTQAHYHKCLKYTLAYFLGDPERHIASIKDKSKDMEQKEQKLYEIFVSDLQLEL